MAIYNLDNDFMINKATKYFEKLVADKAKIELKKCQPKRSNPQNRYLHAIINLFALETGYSASEAKTLAKRQCQFMVYEKEGNKFLRSTADLNTEECTLFIEAFRNYASTTGIYLPSAEEFNENADQLDEYIRINSQYLGG